MSETLNELMSQYIMLENEIIDNGGELTEEMENKLADAESNFETKLDNYERFIRHLKGQINYLKEQEKHYSSRRRAMENSINNLKGRLIYVMDYMKVDKFKTANFNFSVGDSSSWVFDEDLCTTNELNTLIDSGHAVYQLKVSISAIKADNKYTPEEELPPYIKINKKRNIRVR